MTETGTIDRQETEGLYINDAQLIRRMGVPEKKARLLLRYLDDHPKLCFPRKDKLFGDRRYWPAVKAYLDERNRLMIAASTQRGRP